MIANGEIDRSSWHYNGPAVSRLRPTYPQIFTMEAPLRPRAQSVIVGGLVVMDGVFV